MKGVQLHIDIASQLFRYQKGILCMNAIRYAIEQQKENLRGVEASTLAIPRPRPAVVYIQPLAAFDRIPAHHDAE